MVVEATEQPAGTSGSATLVSAAAQLSAMPVPMRSPETPVPARPANREREHIRQRPAGETPAPGLTPPSGGDLPVRAGSRLPNGDEEPRAGCTTAQLRRFIKSRPWVPMHELRRRFGINGADDDVTPIRVGGARLYIGLPPAEGGLMAELLGSGDVGYELSLDPGAPIVVGVYPMRPVPRS